MFVQNGKISGFGYKNKYPNQYPFFATQNAQLLVYNFLLEKAT